MKNQLMGQAPETTIEYKTYIFTQEKYKPMSNSIVIIARQCIDCFGLIRSHDDVYHSAYCDDCFSSICRNCVIIDHDNFLCSGCANVRMVVEEEE
jgi:hypothetical protein